MNAFQDEANRLNGREAANANRVALLCSQHPLSCTTLSQIEDELRKLGADHCLLAGAQFPHPSDKHLQVVIIKRDHSCHQYVVWSHNSDDGAFFWGHYEETFASALEAFLRKTNRYFSYLNQPSP